MKSFINEDSEIEYIIESYTKKNILNELNELIVNYNDTLTNDSPDTEGLDQLKYSEITDPIVKKFLEFKSEIFDDTMSDDTWEEYSRAHDEFLKTVIPKLILENG